MNDAVATFEYVAFNAESGDILAYGETAAQAALRADRLAPDADLQIMKVGRPVTKYGKLGRSPFHLCVFES
jgi:hypothetical protein